MLLLRQNGSRAGDVVVVGKAQQVLAAIETPLFLSKLALDIIAKHMWPLTLPSYPRYRESLVVSTADKICAVAEFFHLYHALRMESRLSAAVRLFRPGPELREG